MYFNPTCVKCLLLNPSTYIHICVYVREAFAKFCLFIPPLLLEQTEQDR